MGFVDFICMVRIDHGFWLNSTSCASRIDRGLCCFKWCRYKCRFWLSPTSCGCITNSSGTRGKRVDNISGVAAGATQGAEGLLVSPRGSVIIHRFRSVRPCGEGLNVIRFSLGCKYTETYILSAMP